MSVRAINSQSGTAGLRAASPTSVDIVHDILDHKIKYKDDQGVVQVLTGDGQLRTGPVQVGAAAGAAGGSTEVINSKVLVDNVATDVFLVTVPNAIAGAAIELIVTSTLGDGDSTDSAIYMVAVSRVAGAAAKGVASTKSVVGATAGVTANAVVTAAVSAITGAVGAVNTFTITVKNARSAGAAAGHPMTAVARLLNNVGGVTIANA